jgi:phage-related protein
MARWNVRPFTTDTGAKPVEDWIRSLPQSGRIEVLAAIDDLEEAGIDLHLPAARPLRNGVWELRVRDPAGIYRILYFHWRGRTFGLLHGFTKTTRATPERELQLALNRRATWLARERRRND